MDKFLERITVDPAVMTGKPVIRGTRITVEAILERLYGGMSPADIQKEIPHISADDVKAAQLYTLNVLRNEDVFVE